MNLVASEILMLQFCFNIQLLGFGERSMYFLTHGLLPEAVDHLYGSGSIYVTLLELYRVSNEFYSNSLKCSYF